MSSLLAKVAVLSYDSAAVTKTSALKSYYRSVRLIRDASYVNPIQPSYITNILLCGNCIDAEERTLYVFYIDTFFHSAWIIEINIDSRTQKVVYYDKYNDIGFDPLHKIYNPRVVHGRLVWTDNLNPIYQMDIKRAKKSFELKIGYGQYPNVSEWSGVYAYGIDQIVSNGNRFYKNLVDNNLDTEPKLDDGTNWKELCLIEDAYYSMNVENFLFEAVPPMHPPLVEYQADESRKINNLRQTLFQFAYRYVYIDWRKSTFSPASIVPVPQAEEETATGLANEQISRNNKFQIAVNSGGEEVRAIEVIGRSSADPSKWFLIETINKFSDQERGNELSRTSEPGYISTAIEVLAPTVTGINIVNSEKTQLGLWIISPIAFNTNVQTDMSDMVWEADKYGQSEANPANITTNGTNTSITLDSKPDWITILSSFTGAELLAGWTILEGDTLLVFPTAANLGEQRSGVIHLSNYIGDFTVINVMQTAPSVIVSVAVPCTIQKDPLDLSDLTITEGIVYCMSLNNYINFSVLPDHSGYAYGSSYTMYWRALVTRDGITLPQGNGEFTVTDESYNAIEITLNTTLQAGDVVVVYLSSSSALESQLDKVSIGLGIPTPSVLNSYIMASYSNMTWEDDQSGIAEAITALITCNPAWCVITAKPDWVTVQTESGYNAGVGWSVHTGEILSIFPTANNLGAEKIGFITLMTQQGDSVTIVVSQAEVRVSPTGTPISGTLQVYSGDTAGLTLLGAAADGTSNSKNILWTALIEHSAHAEEAWTMYWRATINGIVRGSGNFAVQNGSSVGTIVVDIPLLVGDIVVIDFSSVTF